MHTGEWSLAVIDCRLGLADGREDAGDALPMLSVGHEGSVVELASGRVTELAIIEEATHRRCHQSVVAAWIATPTSPPTTVPFMRMN